MEKFVKLNERRETLDVRSKTRDVRRSSYFLRRTSIVIILFILTATGCTTKLPDYIKDDYPYKKRVAGSYDQVLEATKVALKELGWSVDKEVDPTVYEVNKLLGDPDARQILFFTNKRKTRLTMGRRYSRLNVYLRSGKDKEVEVEIRYMGVTALPLKKLYDYHNEKLVDTVFQEIEKKLN